MVLAECLELLLKPVEELPSYALLMMFLDQLYGACMPGVGSMMDHLILQAWGAYALLRAGDNSVCAISSGEVSCLRTVPHALPAVLLHACHEGP